MTDYTLKVVIPKRSEESALGAGETPSRLQGTAVSLRIADSSSPTALSE